MLNLSIVMRAKILPFLLLVSLAALSSWHGASAQSQTPAAPEITAPGPAAALQGLVQVSISAGQGAYQQAELAFAYTSDPLQTWFLIWESDEPLPEGELAVWDTTVISDGDYDLRLTVTDEQGQKLHSLVTGLRVRNYTAIETNTPSPAQPTATATSTQVPPPTATLPPPGSALENIPANPASLGVEQIQMVIVRSALVVLLIFLVIGLYAFLRGWLRSRV